MTHLYNEIDHYPSGGMGYRKAGSQERIIPTEASPRGRFDLNGRKKWVVTGLRGAGKTDLGDGICRELTGLMVSWK
jgi:hypothetical protein